MTAKHVHNALFLAGDESRIALDRKVLRASGVRQAIFLDSGQKALEYLGAATGMAASAAGAAHGPVDFPGSVDLVICHERLGDMTGLQFLALARENALCASLPVLLLVGDAASPAARAASASESCAVLARPYSAEAAESAIGLAMRPGMQKAPLVLPPWYGEGFATPGPKREEARRPLISRPARKAPPGEIALREGLAALQRNDMDTAEKFLGGAHAADPLRAETCLALARLAQMRFDEETSFSWIARAAALCLRRGDTARGREIISRLPRGKAGQAPLLRVAGEDMQRGEIRAAALLFMEAQRLDPGQGLHALVARACMFMPAPEEAIRELVRALATSGHESTAARLRARLLHEPRAEEEDGDYGFLSRFPVLNDIVTVAAHTFKTWRHAA